jgi:hypothetical protein
VKIENDRVVASGGSRAMNLTKSQSLEEIFITTEARAKDGKEKFEKSVGDIGREPKSPEFNALRLSHLTHSARAKAIKEVLLRRGDSLSA